MAQRQTGQVERRRARHRSRGQAIVEFAITSIIFLLVVFGTIDFGRSVFMYSELTNAVREGARTARVRPTDTNAIKNAVIAKSPGLGLNSGAITVTCLSSCTAGQDIKVQATLQFQAITQQMLGISPFTMTASARVGID